MHQLSLFDIPTVSNSAVARPPYSNLDGGKGQFVNGILDNAENLKSNKRFFIVEDCTEQAPNTSEGFTKRTYSVDKVAELQRICSVVPSEIDAALKAKKKVPAWKIEAAEEKKALAEKLGCDPDLIITHTRYQTY